MKFNVFFTIRGPAGETEAPNKSNPIECKSLAECMEEVREFVASQATGQGLVTFVGVRIEEATTSRG